jgi:hypothetical protein
MEYYANLYNIPPCTLFRLILSSVGFENYAEGEDSEDGDDVNDNDDRQDDNNNPPREIPDAVLFDHIQFETFAEPSGDSRSQMQPAKPLIVPMSDAVTSGCAVIIARQLVSHVGDDLDARDAVDVYGLLGMDELTNDQPGSDMAHLVLFRSSRTGGRQISNEAGSGKFAGPDVHKSPEPPATSNT